MSDEESSSNQSHGSGGEEDNDGAGDDQFECDVCNAILEIGVVRFHCEECKDFDVCGDCYFAAEGRALHPHPLIKVSEQEIPRIVWQFKDPTSSNHVMISNWPAAIASLCPDLTLKSVKSVLSLIEKTEMQERAAELQAIYKGQPYARQDGIVYCHIALPDAINPSMVFRDRPELAELLERSSIFIDRALQHGNVLVHCQKGQKRSPTIVLAWLITKGYGTSDAINLISRSYTSDDYSVTDPGRSWGERYRKERPLWVERLNEWARGWRALQSTWIGKHNKLLQSWEVLHRAARAPSAAEPDAKRTRKATDEEESKEHKSVAPQSSHAKT